MRTVTFAVAALAGGLAAAAGAAQAQPAPNQVDDWSGPYVGVNLGWDNPSTHVSASEATVNQASGLQTGTGTTATVAPTTIATSRMDFDDSYRTGGFTVGYNQQMGRFVLGLEGDVDAQGNEEFSQGSAYALPATALTTASRVTINRFTFPYLTSTVRGRAGVAFGRLLLYGTGGLALGDVRQEANYAYEPFPTTAAAAANPPTSFLISRGHASFHDLMTGWTLGGGAEWRIGRTLSIGAEYRHMDFGSEDFYAVTLPTGVSELTRLGYGDNQVLAKLNFHF